jgi:long-chain acyl-CoA synthetase
MEHFVEGGWEKFSYRQLDDMVTRLAAGLLKLGLKPGDHIGVLGENRPQWAIAYIAVQRMGGITVPLDRMMSDAELHHIIAESESKAVIVSAEYLGIVLDAYRPGLIIIDMDNGDREGTLKFNEVLKSSPTIPDFHKVGLEDIAVIIFTSGTTGYSKGVMLTHNNIIGNVASCYQIFELGPESHLVSVLPMHHTFEATCGFLFPLYLGATITYARSLKSKELIEDIKNSKCNLMVGVPLLYEKMYEGIRRNLKKLPLTKKVLVNSLYTISQLANSLGLEDVGKTLFKSLREKAGLDTVHYFVSGGAALPPYIAEFFHLLGIPLFQGYGLTETSPVLTVNPPMAPKHSAVGIAIPGVEVAIRDQDSFGVGEIIAKGPNIFKGYYKNEKATAECFRDDWFLTGDLGWMDDEGYVYITGRKKNLLVTGGGKNVYPEEIEAFLNQQTHIMESLVLGVQRSGGMGDEVEAIIVPDYEIFDKEAEEHNIKWTPEEIEKVIKSEVAEVNAKIAEYKKIKKFTIRTEEFMKTSTKKIKRYLHQQEYLEVNGNSKSAH